MHRDQLEVDDRLARRLIEDGFPELGGSTIRRLRTPGTVNAIVRVGDGHTARFPLVATPEAELLAEAEALDEFSVASPVPAPRSYGIGSATAEYGSGWSVQTWVPGETASHDAHAASLPLAEDVATLILALRSADPRGRTFGGQGRGGALPEHDEWVAICIENSRHLVDADRTAALWARLRALPSSTGDAMSHRDLTPFNLLVEDDRLVGVLDGGGFGPADPALDLVAAWHLFDEPARQVVRERVGADDVQWRRGAAWALQQAMGLVWYYERTNPAMSALGLSTMRRLLQDAELARLIRCSPLSPPRSQL